MANFETARARLRQEARKINYEYPLNLHLERVNSWYEFWRHPNAYQWAMVLGSRCKGLGPAWAAYQQARKDADALFDQWYAERENLFFSRPGFLQQDREWDREDRLSMRQKRVLERRWQVAMEKAGSELFAAVRTHFYNTEPEPEPRPRPEPWWVRVSAWLG